jgi:hypothetical protein
MPAGEEENEEDEEDDDDDDDDDVPEQKCQWRSMAIPEKKFSLSYWPITKIERNEGKAVKPGQLSDTRQHNHATVCLVSKCIKKYHIQIITNSLGRIWHSHGDFAEDTNLPGCEIVSTGK